MPANAAVGNVIEQIEQMQLGQDRLPSPPLVCFNCGTDGPEDVGCIVAPNRQYHVCMTTWYLWQRDAYKRSLVYEKKGIPMPMTEKLGRPRPKPRHADNLLTTSSSKPVLPPTIPRSKPVLPPMLPPSKPVLPPMLPPGKPVLNWPKQYPGPELRRTEGQKYIAGIVNMLFAISNPAYEDSNFLQLHIVPGEPLLDKVIHDKIRQQCVVYLTGGEDWNGCPFAMKTLMDEGIVLDPNEVYDFVDMDALSARMQNLPTVPPKVHRMLKRPEFFEVIKDPNVSLNCLECPYTTGGWHPHMRSFVHHTLEADTISTGDYGKSRKRTDAREGNWALITSPGCLTKAHHDAGGRYTFVAQNMGIKIWWYLCPNNETQQRLHDDPHSVITNLKSYKEARMKALGSWFYANMIGGTQMILPSWIKHMVWTPTSSLTAGKLFDLTDFDRMEHCLIEEHRTGLRSTNAERMGWYSNILNFAANLPQSKLASMLTTKEIKALINLLTNPNRYTPQRELLTPDKFLTVYLLRLGLHLGVMEYKKTIAHKDWKIGNSTLPGPQNESRVFWKKCTNSKHSVLPMNHNARVQKLLRAVPALQEVLKKKGQKMEVIKLHPWIITLQEREETGEGGEKEDGTTVGDKDTMMEGSGDNDYTPTLPKAKGGKKQGMAKTLKRTQT
ncbi:hypothetical protein CALCODRAFT_486337 [Calocera cornea HHB12733]|uniref:Uncharacterized protein n=1 Tax=Calocera cornea HHB12733 TaxID=1353952 RepID=A0A165DS76_9BASI|nr:hypothetical protein CALCODRAFT_486337 [Calocera cornea HHB12733]